MGLGVCLPWVYACAPLSAVMVWVFICGMLLIEARVIF